MPARARDRLRALFMLSASIYLVIYAFEGPIRYALDLSGHDNAIFLRDMVLLAPLLLLLVRQAFHGSIHPAYWVAAVIVAVHGAVAYGNFHSASAPVYGAKFLMPVLFGFIAATALTYPSRRMLWLIALLWITTLVAVALDKYVYTFPWTGMETHIGGLTVDVSRGWDITDSEAKRAAGFTRSSIDAAALLPVLGFILAQRARYLIRAVILAATAAGLFMTTQKGAFVAFAVVAAIFFTPRHMWYVLLRAALVSLTIFMVALPIASIGLLLGNDGGVFSTASLGMRVMSTWPGAWAWINHNDIFPFGTGLGGLSGAMRFFARDSYNPTDNLFIFLYGNFGVPTFLYLAWINWQAFRLPPEARRIAIAAVAILAFDAGYGAVLGLLEGPICAFFIGAAIGTLWQLRQAVEHRRWANPFAAAWNYPMAVPARPPVRA